MSATSRSYDERCHELASLFLRDHAWATEAAVVALAIAIQTTIEDHITDWETAALIDEPRFFELLRDEPEAL